MKSVHVLLTLILVAVLAFGGLGHALLPHEHVGGEMATSLLHSAVRHEDKTLGDIVPPAPLFAVTIITALLSILAGRELNLFMLRARAPTLTQLSRGVLLYRRFR
jgi:hypothetical protein